jgi:hypothetical protein
MTDTAEDTIVRIPPSKNKGGEWVQMGMEEYRIPPLGFAAIKDMQANLEILQGMKDAGAPNDDQMKVVAEVVHAAMRRNYPDMTSEQVLDMLDLGNFRKVFEAVLGMSGYRKAASGEALAPTTP